VTARASGPLAPAANAIEGGTVHQTVNYYPPHTADPRPSRQLESKPRPPKPRPNIQFHTTRVANAAPGESDVLRERSSAGAKGIFLNITNDALLNVQNAPADVKATLIFFDAANPDEPKQLARATGVWIDKYGDTMQFEVDASHDLFLMGLADGECGSFTVRPSTTELGLVYEFDGFDINASERVRIRVRLFDPDTGEVFCELSR